MCFYRLIAETSSWFHCIVQFFHRLVCWIPIDLLLSPKKDIRADRSTFTVRKSYAQEQIEAFNKKYPSSSTMTPCSKGNGENAEWQKEKQQISSTYTIAPAYNKGAYQVVPKNEVKHIGK